MPKPEPLNLGSTLKSKPDALLILQYLVDLQLITLLIIYLLHPVVIQDSLEASPA